MAARNVSGAEAKRGKDRKRSSSSRGRPLTVDTVSGEGLRGRLGLLSMSNARSNERGSPGPGSGAAA